MVGIVVLEPSGGWRPRLEEVQIRGLRLYRASVPVPARPSPKRLERRIRRAGHLLREAGCRRALTAEAFSGWPVLEEAGLRRVDPGPLCRAMGAELARAWLAARQLPPGEAVVALCGDGVDARLFEAAQALCPEVRGLILRAGERGRELAVWLEDRYGLPVLEEDRRACLRLWYDPPPDPPEERDLVLCGPVPALGGLSLRPPFDPPEELAPLPFTALLWEEGRLAPEELRIQLDSTGKSTYNVGT